MKMRPNRLAVLVFSMSLLLASTTAKANSTFFSINFGYSNYGYNVSPYRYIYTPAFYNSIPSPFFFGYTSYYYPAFPYYFTPVVYYRPVLPFYYPYAYRPNWIYYNRYNAYRGFYPGSYNRYYSYYPQKHYNYRPDHHNDHFYGHHNKQQYAGSYNKYSPENRQYIQQRPGNHDVRTSTVLNKNNSQQRRRTNQRTEQHGVRHSRGEQQTLAASDPRPVLGQRQNRVDTERVYNKNQQTEQSKQSEHDANNARIDRLINRDRNPSRSETGRNNRPIQQRQIINQHNERTAKTQVNTLDKRTTELPVQSRKIYQQQPAVTRRSNQNDQRQVTRQQTGRNTMEKPGNGRSFRQEQVVSERNRKDSQQSGPDVRKRESSTETTGIRGNNQLSLRQNNGYGLQQRQMPQRSFSGAGYRR
jgi:hypothetical protein